MKKPWKLLAGIALLLLAGLIALNATRHETALIVDNGLAVPLRIELDGDLRGDVEPGATLRVSGIGSVTPALTATELAGEGRRFTLPSELASPTLGQDAVYVWNVNGATATYWIVTQGYGNREGEHPEPQEFKPESDLFALPPGLQATLDERHPKNLEVPKGVEGALVKALFSQHFVDAQAGATPDEQARLQAMMAEAQARRAAEEKAKKKGQKGPSPTDPEDPEVGPPLPR